jgi:hypothetical protein
MEPERKYVSDVRQVYLNVGRAVSSQDREDVVKDCKRIKPYGMHASLHSVTKRGQELQLHQIDGGRSCSSTHRSKLSGLGSDVSVILTGLIRVRSAPCYNLAIYVINGF